MKKKVKFMKEKAITLIALVVTIIVLLILAAVAINLTIGDNGIIKRAEDAREIAERAKREEELQLDLMDSLIKYYEIKDEEDYIEYIEDIIAKLHIQGVYKVTGIENMNGKIIKLDCVREDNSTLYREEIEISNEEVKLNNSKKTNKIDDEAKLLKIFIDANMKNEELPPEVIFIGDDIVEYNGNEYVWINEEFEDDVHYEWSTYFEKNVPMEITGEWKDVFVGEECAIAIDINDELWGWFPEKFSANKLKDIEPIKLKELDSTLPEKIVVKKYRDVIFLINEEASNFYYRCYADGIQKKNLNQTINIKDISYDAIIDENGKIWKYSSDGELESITDENDIVFEKFNPNVYDSETGIAIDKNGDFWNIKFYNKSIKNVSEEARKNGKNITQMSNAIALANDGNLYYYFDFEDGSEFIDLEANIKELSERFWIDENGQLYVFVDHHSGMDYKLVESETKFDKFIVPDYRPKLLDENGDLWILSVETIGNFTELSSVKLEKYLKMQDNWKNYSTYNYATMIIDENSKMLVYGNFEY